MSTNNPLVSASQSSDSGLHVSLHPLVLLTISDYITRHSLRHQTQPIIGALLGQQKGREITIEHAYDVKLLDPSLSVPGAFDTEENAEGEQTEWKLHESWFADRLQQYKDVHKDPTLELVGWWTLSPPSGPGSEVLGIHRHILQTFNETALLLTFHPEDVQKEQMSVQSHSGQKMPLTIYESIYEAKRDEDVDADRMQVEVDGEGKELNIKLEIKLRELPYEIVTGEAEMIGMDFVAKGSGNATAVETGQMQVDREAEKATSVSSKGKGKTGEDSSKEINGLTSGSSSALNPEEEELVSFLTSRANAIKMLQSRLSLLKSYLHALPPSYLTDPALPTRAVPQSSSSTAANAASDSTDGPHSAIQISHPTLRALLALTSRLPHLFPTDSATFARDQAAERSDVAIVSLLGSLGRSVSEAKELGRTFSAVDGGRSLGKKADRWAGSAGGMPPGAGAMDLDESSFDSFMNSDGFGESSAGGSRAGLGWDSMIH